MKQSTALTALSALAQETRLDIFRLLVRAGAAGLSAGSIAARLDVAAPTLSFHLSQLKQARLLTCRRESRQLFYAANYDAMTGLIAYLTENCCKGVSGTGPAEASPACAPPAADRAPATRTRRTRSSGISPHIAQSA
jgi:ArsR family transcriptional regulator